MTDEEFLALDQGAAGRILAGMKQPEKDRLFTLYTQSRLKTASAPAMPIAAHSTVAPPRIGSGQGYFLLGGFLILAGLVALLAGVGSGEGATALGELAVGLGSGAIAIGFWVSLFGKIERRLIDIEGKVRVDAAPGPASVS